MIRFTVSNDQEAFDAIVRRLYDGRGRAASAMQDGRTKCFYRRPGDELPCAAGAILEGDEDGERVLRENSPSIILLIEREFDQFCNADGALTGYAARAYESGLVNELQCAHDSADNWYGNEFHGHGQLWDLAEQYGLSTAVLDTLAP